MNSLINYCIRPLRLAALFASLLAFESANAQLTLDWCRCAGAGEDEELTDMVALSDGSVVAVGSQNRTPGNGDDNPYIVRIAADGSVIWTFSEDYQSALERIDCAARSTDGNIVVAGSFDPTTGTVDNGYALKINAETGALMWRNAAYFGNSGDDFIYGALPLANNQMLLVGQTDGEAWAFKIDGAGNPVGNAYVAPASSEEFRTAVRLSDGRFVALGRTDGDDPYAVLLSADLSYLGEWTMTGEVGSSILSAVLVQGSDIIFTGIYDSPDTGVDDAIVHRIRVVNNSFQTVWAQPFVWDYNFRNDVGRDIALDEQGNVWVIIQGDFGAENDIVVKKLSSATGAVLLTHNVLISDQPDNAGAVMFTDTNPACLVLGIYSEASDAAANCTSCGDGENETDFMVMKYETCFTRVNAVGDPVTIPESFQVSAYPNPFNAATRIELMIPQSGVTSLRIYDVLGEEVATLIDGPLAAGSHQFSWDARNLASGIYFVNASAAIGNMTQKLVLLK